MLFKGHGEAQESGPISEIKSNVHSAGTFALDSKCMHRMGSNSKHTLISPLQEPTKTNCFANNLVKHYLDK